MKQIDVIRSGSLASIIGPSGTMKRIIKNKDYFISRGYDINIFTHDSIRFKKTNVIPDVSLNSKKRSRLKEIITIISKKCRMMAKRNIILANFFIWLSDYRVSKLLKYYISLGRTPDVLVFHSDSEMTLYCKLSSYRPKIVTFLHSDGTHTMSLSYYPCVKNKWGERHMIDQLSYSIKTTDRLVFISKIAHDNFVANNPDISKEKIGLAVNGIEDFTNIEKSVISDVDSRYIKFKYRLVCTGTINRRKGQGLVLSALSKTKPELQKQIHISFIGDGPQKDELENFVKEAGLINNVTFEGSVDNSLVYKYLAEHNIYILMSENEGLPISIIEAMRASLPIISTNIAGIPETIDNNGILLNVKEEDLLNVFNNIDKYDWTRMGSLSREKFIREFSFPRMAKDYCDIMDSLFT